MMQIDFNSAEFSHDPYPFYRQLQQADGPYWLAHTQPNSTLPGMWLFSKYDDVANIIKESNSLSKQITRIRQPEQVTPMDTTMLNQDPPDHTRLRALVSQAFTPERIRQLAPGIEQVVDTLIGRMEASPDIEFVRDFAIPLPIMVIADFMGVPFDDHVMFCRWAELVLRGYDSGVKNTDNFQSYRGAIKEMEDYFAILIEQRRKQPTDDLISNVIQARDKHEKLDSDELLSMLMLLLVSAHETTTNLLSSGMLTLLRNPQQIALLKAEPELMPSAIEEILRYESPLQRATFRITTKPCSFGGKMLQPGEQVTAILGAANRDPKQFPDPDKFDVARTPNRHLAFGLGIHFCLGAFLARTEARIGFGRLIERMPELSLTSQPPVWNDKKLFRGLTQLPLTLSHTKVG